MWLPCVGGFKRASALVGLPRVMRARESCERVRPADHCPLFSPADVLSSSARRPCASPNAARDVSPGGIGNSPGNARRAASPPSRHRRPIARLGCIMEFSKGERSHTRRHLTTHGSLDDFETLSLFEPVPTCRESDSRILRYHT